MSLRIIVLCTNLILDNIILKNFFSRSGLERTTIAAPPAPISAKTTLPRRKPSGTPAPRWTAAASQTPPATSPVPRSAGRRQTGERPGNSRASHHTNLSVESQSIKQTDILSFCLSVLKLCGGQGGVRQVRLPGELLRPAPLQ